MSQTLTCIAVNVIHCRHFANFPKYKLLNSKHVNTVEVVALLCTMRRFCGGSLSDNACARTNGAPSSVLDVRRRVHVRLRA